MLAKSSEGPTQGEQTEEMPGGAGGARQMGRRRGVTDNLAEERIRCLDLCNSPISSVCLLHLVQICGRKQVLTHVLLTTGSIDCTLLSIKLFWILHILRSG